MKSKISIYTAVLLMAVFSVNGQVNIDNGRNSQIQPVVTVQKAAITTNNPATTSMSDQDLPTKDNVITTSQIIQGSLGVGVDCVNPENYGFNTILLKENNLRIKFEDTSNPPYPTNDWTLIANESTSGGANYFAIEDATASVIPFKVMAGAPTNALNIAANGNMGFSTSYPVLALHTNKSDTPGLRLEQNITAGWPAYTWDIAANESNFFIRDVTSGSKMPFRIRPGAPTNSIYISDNGNVGIGTASPTETLDINGSMKLKAILTAPATPTEGTLFMDGNDHLIKYHDGSQWNTLSNSDDQDLVSATLTGSTLQINIENGASVSVDLSPLLADLDARITAIETFLGVKEIKSNKINISQNAPNPFNKETNIAYYIPNDINNASIEVYNVKGVKIKEIPIDTRGNGNLKITCTDLEPGTYFYTLIMDGKKSESRTMVKID